MVSVNCLQTSREKSRFLDALRRRHLKYTILFLFGVATGLRVSDILRLRVRDVAYVPLHITEQKTGKVRIIDFTLPEFYDLYLAILAYIDHFRLLPGDYLIFSRPSKKRVPLSRVQAYRVLRAAGASAGLSGIGTHSMRKTFAREHFKAHGDLKSLQLILNHKYLHTTLMYLLTPDAVRSLLGS